MNYSPFTPGQPVPPVLIAGIGNLLLQDDGFGPQAVARLHAEFELPDDVEVLDLGTPTLDFVDYLEGRKVVILLDALSCGGEPGALLTYSHDQLRQNIPGMRLSAHQPCLQETVHAAETAGMKFDEFVLVGVVGTNFDVGTDLGADVSAALPRALEFVVAILAKYGIAARRREHPLKLDAWWEAKPAAGSHVS